MPANDQHPDVEQNRQDGDGRNEREHEEIVPNQHSRITAMPVAAE
jgi:hypothetical protein